MTAYLAGTNVAVRWLQPRDPQYAACRAAVRVLQSRAEPVFITPQVIMEYWALTTRPVTANGSGMTVAQATQRARLLLRNFPLLPDTEAVFHYWQQLVEMHEIIGRQVYDARITAVMRAHNIHHLLTLNPTHFRRFSEITLVARPAT